MKRYFRLLKSGFYCFLSFRKKIQLNMSVAKTQHSSQLFIKYFRFNIAMSVLLGYYLFSLHALWFLEQYTVTMSLMAQFIILAILITFSVVLAFSKKEKLIESVQEDTKTIVGLNRFVSIFKTIVFNSMLTLMFYTLSVILFDLSVSHLKLLSNLIESCIVCTLGAILMIYIDWFVCIAIAIRLHKISGNF